MARKGVTRKLAAILYADVAGYSRLTGVDEEGTHETLSAHLDAVTTSIEGHQGRVVHFAGDAVLAEFASVLAAVTCAVEVQRELGARNQGVPDNRKVQFRMGIITMVAQSGGEVNRLLDRRLVECLPATDAAHGDLPRGHQGPEQHGRRFRVG